MNNHLEQKIITPRIAELVSSNGSDLETKKTSSGQVRAEIQSNNIAGTRLTCCCKYENHIICAGFSGELFFVEKDSLCVKRKDRISNSIIRCLKVIHSEKALLVSTDAGEVIVYDLEHNVKQYYEHSSSPVYNIALRNPRDFITSERNGDIFEWQYIPGVGVFRNKRIFTTNNPVFAMDIIGTSLVVVSSLGKKYEYDFLKSKLKSTSICDSNVFCLKEGADDAVYYGLSTGAILFEEPGCDFVALDSHQDAVRDLVFSTNKKWMFSVSKDRTVRAWHNGIPRVLTRVKDYLYQIVFEESNSCLYYVDGHGDIGAIHFSSDIDLVNNIDIHRFIANAGAIIMKEIVSVKRANGKTIEYRAIVVNGKIVCFDYDSSSGLPSPESLPCAWQFEDCINTASKNGLHGAYFVDFGVDENENIFVVECKNIINGTVKNINAFAEGLAKIAMD